MKIELQIRFEDLPATYQMIAKAIGIENALRLGEELGGEQICFPRLRHIKMEDLPATYQMIAKIIGIENAIRFGEELGGEQIYFPKLQHMHFSREARRRKIASEYNGHNIKELAAKYGVTSRMIYATIRKEKIAKGGKVKTSAPLDMKCPGGGEQLIHARRDRRPS